MATREDRQHWLDVVRGAAWWVAIDSWKMIDRHPQFSPRRSGNGNVGSPVICGAETSCPCDTESRHGHRDSAHRLAGAVSGRSSSFRLCLAQRSKDGAVELGFGAESGGDE